MSAIASTPLDDVAISKALLAHRIDVPAISASCIGEPKRTGFVFGFGNTSAERIAPALALFAAALGNA